MKAIHVPFPHSFYFFPSLSNSVLKLLCGAELGGGCVWWGGVCGGGGGGEGGGVGGGGGGGGGGGEEDATVVQGRMSEPKQDEKYILMEGIQMWDCKGWEGEE